MPEQENAKVFTVGMSSCGAAPAKRGHRHSASAVRTPVSVHFHRLFMASSPFLQRVHRGDQISGGYGSIEKCVDAAILPGADDLTRQLRVAVFVAEQRELAPRNLRAQAVDQAQAAFQRIRAQAADLHQQDIRRHGGAQGERIYSPEGVSCTLTSQAGGMGGKTGLYCTGVPIKENTKKGYKMAYPGDSIDLGYAGMNTRRGRVGHQIAHTLTTGIQQGTLHFVDLSPPPLVTEHCRCLNTRQSGIHNHKGECSGVLKEEGARAVLTPGREETRQNGRRMKEPEEPMFTITATDRHGVAYRGRIRRLVPRECLRLQGFYDWQIDRIEQETSDSQLYKQAGNGVTVNVIEAIGTLLRQADTEIRAEDEKTKR